MFIEIKKQNIDIEYGKAERIDSLQDQTASRPIISWSVEIENFSFCVKENAQTRDKVRHNPIFNNP